MRDVLCTQPVDGAGHSLPPVTREERSAFRTSVEAAFAVNPPSSPASRMLWAIVAFLWLETVLFALPLLSSAVEVDSKV